VVYIYPLLLYRRNGERAPDTKNAYLPSTSYFPPPAVWLPGRPLSTEQGASGLFSLLLLLTTEVAFSRVQCSAVRAFFPFLFVPSGGKSESLFVALPPRQLCHPFPTAPAGFGTPAASLHHHHRAARFPLPREQGGRWALHCQLLPIPRQPHHSREGRPLTTGSSAPDPATSFLLSFFRNTGSPGGSGLRQPRQGRILSPSATMGLS
jgi:hypothetical protein